MLYLSPTKALAADQLRALRALDVPGVRAATYDGDTPTEERDWVRQHATYVLTNPDMLHRSLLPAHARWASFLRALRYVVVDECHGYRGVFGSHVAAVLRRLRRVCARYGATPVFLLASATVADPRVLAPPAGRRTAWSRSPTTPRREGGTAFALWEPPLTDLRGEGGAPVRRTATAEAADLLADLVVEGARTLAFVRSRRGAEAVALHGAAAASRRSTRRSPARWPPTARATCPRSGARWSRRCRPATSSALADHQRPGARRRRRGARRRAARRLAGHPRLAVAAGRAGRPGGAGARWPCWSPATTRWTPTSCTTPRRSSASPVEATVLDPDNPYVLAPHLCAAAAELPLTEADLALFGPATRGGARRAGRARAAAPAPGGWFWTRRDRAADLADIRGTGGAPVRVVEAGTGPAARHGRRRGGAHHRARRARSTSTRASRTWCASSTSTSRWRSWSRRPSDYSTTARDLTDIRILETDRSQAWGAATLSFGTVEVTNQVVAFLRKRIFTGEVLGEEPLDLPAAPAAHAGGVVDGHRGAAGRGRARADRRARAPRTPRSTPRSGCCRCSPPATAGTSAACRPPCTRTPGCPPSSCTTGTPAARGSPSGRTRGARAWLTATREAIASCECETGCPSCVQSPKCGNGNDPLDKAGAVRLLDVLLAGAPSGRSAVLREHHGGVGAEPDTAAVRHAVGGPVLGRRVVAGLLAEVAAVAAPVAVEAHAPRARVCGRPTR